MVIYFFKNRSHLWNTSYIPQNKHYTICYGLYLMGSCTCWFLHLKGCHIRDDQSIKKSDFTVDLLWWGSLQLMDIIPPNLKSIIILCIGGFPRGPHFLDNNPETFIIYKSTKFCLSQSKKSSHTHSTMNLIFLFPRQHKQ